jgi:hypothetical protein
MQSALLFCWTVAPFRHIYHSLQAKVMASFNKSAALAETDDIFPILVLTANSTTLVI